MELSFKKISDNKNGRFIDFSAKFKEHDYNIKLTVSVQLEEEKDSLQDNIDAHTPIALKYLERFVKNISSEIKNEKKPYKITETAYVPL